MKHLTREQEREVVTRWRVSRDPEALRLLCESHRALIYQRAHSIHRRAPQLDFDDLAQVGFLGFLRALERFDLARNLRLVTIAYPWIVAFQLQLAARTHGPVRFPMSRPARLIYQRLGRARLATGTDDTESLAAAIGITAEQLRDLLPRIECRDVPLDGARGADRPDRDIAVAHDRSPEDDCLASEIRVAIDRLPPREAAILRGRVYREQTLADIGAELGVTRERVRQLEARALRRLRQMVSP